MAVVATFTHINIATSHLQRGVGFDAFDGLRRGFLKEQGDDFYQTTNRDDENDENHHQQTVGLDFFVAKALRFILV
jgi:hypothetical protein